MNRTPALFELNYEYLAIHPLYLAVLPKGDCIKLIQIEKIYYFLLFLIIYYVLFISVNKTKNKVKVRLNLYEKKKLFSGLKLLRKVTTNIY